MHSLLVSELLVNGTDLLLNVNVLHMTQLSLTLSVHGTIIAVDSSLLSARQLVLGNCLPGHGVEDVATLAGKTLEVVCDVNMRDIGRSIA